MRKMRYRMLLCGLACVLAAGCSSASRGNIGNFPTFDFKSVEPEWIRNGKPIEYEGEKWYPQDMVDIWLDSEVLLLGVYRDVQFFVAKIDVRPYNRLYTKFGRDKFRVYEKEQQ